MRNYKKKTNRGTTPVNVIKRAANLVLENEGNKDFSRRKIAKDFDIHYSTLSRYVSKTKKLREISNTSEMPNSGYAKAKQVFTEEQELTLVRYIKRSSDIMFGLDPISVRKLAYQCAQLHEIKFPPSWNENKQAGVEWLNLFLKRHSELSIRQPEATSLARATSFNRSNVTMFFDKLSDVLSRHQFEACSVWNLDETGVSTVLRPRKIHKKPRKCWGYVQNGIAIITTYIITILPWYLGSTNFYLRIIAATCISGLSYYLEKNCTRSEREESSCFRDHNQDMDVIKSNLKCPICWEYIPNLPNRDTSQCQRGHLFCQNCFNKVRRTLIPVCPLCRTYLHAVETGRHMGLQKIINELFKHFSPNIEQNLPSPLDSH